MNLACVLTVLIGSVTVGMSPFSVMQLLWINIIMDLLAAIAMATEEPPLDKINKRESDPIKSRMISPLMCRSIYSQVLYQLVVMCTFLFGGPTLFGVPFHLVREPLMDDDLDLPRED